MSLSEDLLTGVPAIAHHIGKTERATYHLIYKNEIPSFKIGGKIHSRKSLLDAAFQPQIANG
ncbi:hypothetical protein [Sphingobium phenoxybenzoativorans]|uniref:hypothetical protein n=1 Tax=Sphingobium phenoxybenzoativorans TaxID=1592790 RepID=UPI000872F52A|nr:hypothetical protein [Sphingobium phenoxybenzoativorans]